VQKRILVVDDEPGIRKIVKAYLEKDGFIVDTACDGKEAIHLFNVFQPHLIILDLMLPELSGEEVCQKIRQTSNLPIIMLTAKSSENDRVEGLNIGADDYLVKPFSSRELLARIKAILRRVNFEGNSAEVLIFGKGSLKVYPGERIVKRNEVDIDLTVTEFNILLFLMKSAGQVLSREQLINKVLGLEFKGFDRTIDAHIKNIRKKLDFKKDEYIITIYGVGYKFLGD
jgi:DNA-binding response OmpR family regulator